MAVLGLYEWAHDAMQSPAQSTAVNEGLIREIGISVAARRVAILGISLDFARWIFTQGPVPFRALIAQDCEHGLAALLEEASYDRTEAPFDVPSIRAACVRLAYAMARTDFGIIICVTDWIAAAINDPLPEIRNARFRESQ